MDSTEGLEHEVAIPKENDYHGHPNYLKIYVSLLVLFAISLAAGLIGNTTIMLLVVFGTALIKAILVLGKFMHLQWEPGLVWVAVGLVFFILFAFFWGVYPDIPMVDPIIAK